MKISTEINSSAQFVGWKKSVEYVAKAGFDAWDFSMSRVARRTSNGWEAVSEHPLNTPDYLKFAREMRRIGEDNGIFCNQSHAPFPSFEPFIRNYFKRVIECTAEAGGKICVIHPCNDYSPKQNVEMYAEFLPFAKEHKVKIAAENMWNWDYDKEEALPAACSDADSFVAHIKELDDEYFVACLDIGHAEMRGLNTSAVEMIYTLKDKIQALHIHDNDKWHDNHEIPYSMKIDFSSVIKALKEIGYRGEFTLEADMYIKEGSDVFQKLCDLSKTARKMANEFELL